MKEKIVKHCSDCQHNRVCKDVCLGNAGTIATHCRNFDQDYGPEEDLSNMIYREIAQKTNIQNDNGGVK